MERGSVIDAQITEQEEVLKEIERCKDPLYFITTYYHVIKNGKLVRFNNLTESEKHLLRKYVDANYGVQLKINPRLNRK